MACNCNKCNPTKNCGCKDTALTNPCTYTDCSVGSESCADIQCAECVSYCGTTFQVGDAGQVIKIETGERLDSILQKFALILSQGLGACTSDDLHHAPYNVYAANITNSGFTVVWNGESTETTQIEVFVDSGAGFVSVGTVAPTVLQLAVTGIPADTECTIRLTSTDALAATCNSVDIVATTLL